MNQWIVLEAAITARWDQLEERREEIKLEIQRIDEEQEELQKWYIKAEENMEDKQF